MKSIEIFHSEAMYGAETKQALVKISWGNQETVMHVEDAKRLAYDILDVAHASDGDAFMVDWLRETLKIDEPRIGIILAEFRDSRVRKNGEQ